MAKHNVYLDIPIREVKKVDARFYIFRDDESLVSITVSKGGIKYSSNNSKKPIQIGWLQFDKMVKDWNNG
ncbi:MAG TPA: hypothetical protein VGP43_01115 [Chitinophagaceae bacterium]|nr:hypothetical protein [Chitinophagaceae bacterium]